jgi:hypothetical protein
METFSLFSGDIQGPCRHVWPQAFLWPSHGCLNSFM